MNTQEKIEKLEKKLAELKRQATKWYPFEFNGKKYKISDNLGEMTWEDGKKACANLGGELPPRWMLCAIYDLPELEEIKDIFGAGYYWSSTEYSATYAWNQYFPSGDQTYSYKTSTYYVRCVKGGDIK